MLKLPEIYIGKILFTLLALVVGYSISFLSKKGTRAIFTGVKARFSRASVIAKTRTIRHVINNVLDVIIFAIMMMLLLDKWGVNIGPILASAGLIGLAFSFGAQTLVKDIIAGFFIIVEDQYNVGDRIKVGTHEGEVYTINLRLTVLRDEKGNLIYIPNSQMTIVTRYLPEEIRK
jgi:moderate conductance mechanosensitive channel